MRFTILILICLKRKIKEKMPLQFKYKNMKKIYAWFKSFKEGFEPRIYFRFLGIFEIDLGYHRSVENFIAIDVIDNPDMSAIYGNIWRFGAEFILNKTKE